MNKTIKTEKIVEAVKLLKGMKLIDIEDDALLKIWKNLSNMRSTADKYEADVKDVAESLQDEDYRKWEQRLITAKDKEEKAQKQEYTITPEDTEETKKIIAFYDSYNKKCEVRLNELKNVEVSLEIFEVESKELLKAIKKNNLEIGEMFKLDFMIASEG